MYVEPLLVMYKKKPTSSIITLNRDTASKFLSHQVLVFDLHLDGEGITQYSLEIIRINIVKALLRCKQSEFLKFNMKI